MKSNTKKWLALLLAGMMALSLVACGGGNDDEELLAVGSEVIYPEDGSVYPVSCEDELTVWATLNSSLATRVTNFGETELAQALEDQTGIKVTYIHPAQGGQTEQFNLLIASGDLPDIINYDWSAMGAESSIDNQYILKLNTIIDKWAPNLGKLLKDRPDYEKMIKTDEGSLYVFPFFREAPIDCIYQGPIIRKDLLDKLGLESPETIDEWETVLRAFKADGIEIPFSTSVSFLHKTFAGAFGVNEGSYLVDGKIVFGPAQDEWKDYLTKMNQWYNEGLIDPNIASYDGKVNTTNVLTGRVAATFGSAGGSLGGWSRAKKDDPNFKLAGASYAVAKKGDKPEFAAVSNPYLASSSYAISGKCKNPELAARYLDYGYSEAGRNLYNFGPEGVTYNMDGDKVVFTDLVTQNPDGLESALITYVMGTYSGPFMQDSRIVEAMQSDPITSREAVILWADNKMTEHLLPPTSPTVEEKAESSNIGSEVNTYVGEMTLKFITGLEPLDKFEEYQKNLKSFNLDRSVELAEIALDRYNKR